MLTRVYIDNFRCFVNFEYRPARKQLIFGRNGAGKSSLLDVLLFVRQFAMTGAKPEEFNILGQRTRWMNQTQQTCELEAVLDEGTYIYRLILEPVGDPPRPRVAQETVHLNGKPIFEFQKGEVHLFNDRFEHKVTYPFDWHRSALATITPRPENQKLTRFREWFGKLLCFRLNPFAMGPRTEKEDIYPNVDLSNIASWYRHLVQDSPKESAALHESLRAALDDFRFLHLSNYGENVRILLCEFGEIKFGLGELSDGQRCLICLYTILHFVLAKGGTVILDEPDNFLSLREIQPWLNVVSDMVEENKGQVFVVSHHPEFINQWGPSCGVQFIRDGVGPVRVDAFHAESLSTLSPAEIIARGWERE
jgi:predicted ATPase